MGTAAGAAKAAQKRRDKAEQRRQTLRGQFIPAGESSAGLDALPVDQEPETVETAGSVQPSVGSLTDASPTAVSMTDAGQINQALIDSSMAVAAVQGADFIRKLVGNPKAGLSLRFNAASRALDYVEAKAALAAKRPTDNSHLAGVLTALGSAMALRQRANGAETVVPVSESHGSPSVPAARQPDS